MYVVKHRKQGEVGSYYSSKTQANKQLREFKKKYPRDDFYVSMVVYPRQKKTRKRPRKTQGTKVSGKLNFSGSTSSGKGTVKLYSSGRKGQNAKSIVVKRTSYRTASGQRRVLEIVTTKKVIRTNRK